MSVPDDCTQCGQPYPICKICGAKAVYIPAVGFGNRGSYQHLEPPPASWSPHAVLIEGAQ